MHIHQFAQSYINALLLGDEKRKKEICQLLNGQIANSAKSLDGSSNEFHNACVDLARAAEYSISCQLLLIGIHKFPTDTDLLADFLCYGMRCKDLQELAPIFSKLIAIDKSIWTWRAFSFSIDYLIKQYKSCQDTEEKAKYTAQIESLLSEYKEYSQYFSDQSDREKCYNETYEYYMLIGKTEPALNALKDAIKEIPGKCAQCALQLADYYFDAGKYEDVIAPATVAAMVIEVQPAIDYSYLYFILGASREYKARKDGGSFTEETIRPIYRAYFAALTYSSEKDNLRIENIKKRIRVLEYDSGIMSNIDFSTFG